MTKVLLPRVIMEQLQWRTGNTLSSTEQGGLLLGYRKENAIQITAYTQPQRWDYSTPILFKRSAKGHTELAKNEWCRSGRKADWLGEWHTHPNGSATPSFVDKRSWLRIAKHTGKEMFFLILAQHHVYTGLQQPQPAKLSVLLEIQRTQDDILLG